MTEHFDPYHQWLGIAPKDQPPHHYRLLGIDPFEESADVIEHASDRQMAHVRSLQAGKHAEVAQRLLNEIAAAKVTLLDSQKKSQYDEALRHRKKKKRQELPVATPLPVDEQMVVNAAQAEPKPAAPVVVPVKPAVRQTGILVAALVGGLFALLAVAAVGVGIAWKFMSGPQRAVALAGESAVVDQAGSLKAVSTDESTAASGIENLATANQVKEPPPPPPPAIATETGTVQGVDQVEAAAGTETAPETDDPPASDEPNGGERLAFAEGDDGDVETPPEVSMPAADHPQRSPVPEKAQRDAKRQEIVAIFRPADAKTNDEKQALVDQLLKTAQETSGDLAGRFALLNLARETASAAGDIERSFATVDALDASFVIDAAAVKVACIEQATRESLPTKSKEQVVVAGMGLADELLAVDKYEQAAALIATLQQTARQLRNRDTIEALAERRKRGAELFQHYQRASAALETLKTKPDDPQANAAAGTYTALVKGDWPRGLPLLAKGNSENLRRIAELELAKPQTGGEQATLADAWWDAAADQPELIQQQLKSHALNWYQQATPTLAGLEAARVKARIAQAQEEIDQLADAGGGATAGENSGGDGAKEDPRGVEWAPVPEGGKLSRAISVGPFPADADDRLIVTFLAKAKVDDDLGGRKVLREISEEDGKFRGPLVERTEKYYLFRIHSDKEQAALLVAETFTMWSHSTVDVMVNYRQAPRNGQVPLLRGDNIIIAKQNHNKSDRDDRSWIKLSLTGEGLQQGY